MSAAQAPAWLSSDSQLRAGRSLTDAGTQCAGAGAAGAPGVVRSVHGALAAAGQIPRAAAAASTQRARAAASGSRAQAASGQHKWTHQLTAAFASCLCGQGCRARSLHSLALTSGDQIPQRTVQHLPARSQQCTAVKRHPCNPGRCGWPSAGPAWLGLLRCHLSRFCERRDADRRSECQPAGPQGTRAALCCQPGGIQGASGIGACPPWMLQGARAAPQAAGDSRQRPLE